MKLCTNPQKAGIKKYSETKNLIINYSSFVIFRISFRQLFIWEFIMNYLRRKSFGICLNLNFRAILKCYSFFNFFEESQFKVYMMLKSSYWRLWKFTKNVIFILFPFIISKNINFINLDFETLIREIILNKNKNRFRLYFSSKCLFAIKENCADSLNCINKMNFRSKKLNITGLFVFSERLKYFQVSSIFSSCVYF